MMQAGKEYPFQSFRKRPVVVQACRMDEEFHVDTLEGRMRGNAGDWLIRGVNGELYPCKADIFEKTYEPAELEDARSP